MITIYTVIVVVVFVLHAFFTATEMAFTAVNRVKLRGLVESGDSHAKKLNDFLSKEGVFLGTTLVGTNISVIIVSALSTRIFEEYFDAALVPAVTTLVLVPLTLIFVEIIPKIIARQYAMTMSLYLVTPLNNFFIVFKPIILFINAISRFLLRPIKPENKSWDVAFTKNDLKSLLHSVYESGEVEKNELDLIHRVLDFSGKSVSSAMVPLYRVSSVSAEDTVSTLKKVVSVTGFSRIPVYEERKSNLIGVVNIYDALYDIHVNDDDPVKKYMRQPLFLQEKESVDLALTRLRHEKLPMGLVKDSSGRLSGVITIQDILEELVGDIEDKGYVTHCTK